nr:uncharacterized protein CI109_002974 [Kwoniella shandongensis]KAA5528813.1 hypothetical protein CI109_002974 [Kwoniella shandongensis]
MTSRPSQSGVEANKPAQQAHTRHTRSSSNATIPIIKNPGHGHGRSPSAELLMVPERMDTAKERKRRDSADTLRRKGTPGPLESVTRTPHPAHTPRLAVTPATPLVAPVDSIILSPREETSADRHDRTRKLSNTETFYPSPEIAKEIFRAERASNPTHRRAPTPYNSARRRTGSSGSGSVSSVQRMNSDRSIRSRVSFDSTRSRGSQRTFQSDNEDEPSRPADGRGPMADNGWEPHFGSTTGIGPAGEAIEVIGLGRKKPRHRTFQAAMLKPALRSTSRLSKRHSHSHNQEYAALDQEGGEKPLPSRPMSYVGPIVNTISRFASQGGSTRGSVNRTHARHASQQPMSTTHNDALNVGFDGLGMSPHEGNSRSRGGSSNGFRSLFSSLSLNDPNPHHNLLPAPPSTTTSLSRNRSRKSKTYQPITPPDDLYNYLRLAEVSAWDRWPVSGPGQKATRSIWGGSITSKTKGFEAMGWEWFRRLEAAEVGREVRRLGSWESAGRSWMGGVLRWQEENVPHHPIDIANRWGTQLFALPAAGYDTLEFYDEAVHEAEDNGLLSWITGTLLQTAVSTLHMLRYSSQPFTFHLIPSPRPPSLPPSSHKAHYLWEGFGTMVLVNKNKDVDRSMVIEIRPPSVVDSNVMKEFARGKGDGDWWGFYGDTCIGDVGQANLLQQQNSSYTRCTVGPIVDRKARDPSLVQCLTTWVTRSVDERPRAHETYQSPPRERQRDGSRRPSNYSHNNNRQVDVPPYSNRRPSHSLPPDPPEMYSPSFGNTQQPVFPTPMNGGQPIFPSPLQNQQEYQNYALPGYYDQPISPNAYPQPASIGYSMQPPGSGWMGDGSQQRGFSPMPGVGMPYNMGVSWYGGGMYNWPGMR